MRILSLAIATVLGCVSCVGAQAQGRFVFSTKSSSSGNDVRFIGFTGDFVSGPDWFVQVYAGRESVNNLRVIPGGVLSLNGTGDAAGYTDPFSQIITVPGLTGD